MLASALAAAALDRLFDHPAGHLKVRKKVLTVCENIR